VVCRQNGVQAEWCAGKVVCWERGVLAKWCAGKVECRESGMQAEWCVGEVVCCSALLKPQRCVLASSKGTQCTDFEPAAFVFHIVKQQGDTVY
jgi:hypothetical protein